MPTNNSAALWDKKAQVQDQIETFLSQTAGRALTPEEEARADAMTAEINQIDATLKRESELRAALVDGPSRPTIVVGPDRAGLTPYGYHTFKMSEDEFVQRHASTHLPANHPNHPRNIYQMAAFGEFMQEVTEAGTPGGRVATRLHYRADANGVPSGASTGVPSDAGFLVRTDFSMMLMDKAVETSALAPLCDDIIIGEGADGIEAPYIDETSRANGSRWGGVQVYRRAEAEGVTATRIKTGKWTLDLEDLMGLSYSTGRTIKDAPTHGRITADAFASEFAFKIDDEILRGTGAGQCLGILNAPALISVSKESGQKATTIVTENLSKMWARLNSRSRGNARWFINVDCEPALDTLAKTIGTAGVEPNFVTYGPDGVLRIKGRPVQAIEHCESLGTVGDILLLDLNKYALIRKGAIEAAESMHVLFLYNEMTYRWVWRINGAPKDKGALTPYKGTGNTVSPFVALATRA